MVRWGGCSSKCDQLFWCSSAYQDDLLPSVATCDQGSFRKKGSLSVKSRITMRDQSWKLLFWLCRSLGDPPTFPDFVLHALGARAVWPMQQWPTMYTFYHLWDDKMYTLCSSFHLQEACIDLMPRSGFLWRSRAEEELWILVVGCEGAGTCAQREERLYIDSRSLEMVVVLMVVEESIDTRKDAAFCFHPSYRLHLGLCRRPCRFQGLLQV